MADLNKITYFGETDTRNKRVKFGIKAQDRLKHLYVIGKTGMGKSTLLENMAVQDIQSGEGMAIIDPHGKTADLLLEYVPEWRMKDVVYFAPFDINFPISFNVMEDVGPDKRHLVANGLMSAFKKLFGEESFSDRMQYILQNTILALLEYPGATMLGINKMLVDKAYRDKVVANTTDSSVKSYWTQEFANYTERFAAEAIPAIQNKIGQFTSNPLVRNIIGQEKSSFDLRKIMDEGKILIINLSKGRVGEANANLLGSMIITKIYLAAMSRADQRESELQKLPNFYLYVDEFQSFANESFADILSEARKYKLNLTIAHQYIEQMSEEVRAAVFGNVGTMITFRVGSYDADVLEKEFAPVFTAEDLVNLGAYQMYLKLMINGVSSPPFSAVGLVPIAKPEVSFVEQIIDSSRKTFAKPRAQVEDTIKKWLEEGRVEPKAKARERYEKNDHFDKKVAPFPHGEERRGERPKYPDSKAPPVERRTPRENVDFRRVDKAEEQIKKETVADLPKDDFKPLSAISLESLKTPSNNQRKPSAENLNDLRSMLSTMVKQQPTENKKLTNNNAQPINNSQAKITSNQTSPHIHQTVNNEQDRKTDKIELKSNNSEPKTKEVSEADLKALLGVE